MRNSHNRRKARSISVRAASVIVAVMLALLGGCKDKNANNATTSADIKVGEYGSMTGDTATFGTETNDGIQMAIEEANSTGGVNGKKITLIVEDDQSKADVAPVVVTKLITQDKVVAMLGEVASTRSLRGGAVCQKYQIPMITPSSTNPKVTQTGDYIFRVCFTDDFQGAVDAHFAKEQGYKRVAVVTDIKSDYSVFFAKKFKDEFTKIGGTVAGEQTYSSGDSDFKAQLNSLKESKPDAVLVPGYYTEMGTIARQAREVGLTVPLLGGDGWDSSKLIPGAGTALEGCFFCDHYFSVELKSPETVNFINKFRAKYNTNPSALCALGYDAASLLVDAMKRAKSLDGPGIRDAIAATKDFQGVTGKTTIDANRNARKSALMMQIKGSDFKIYKTYTPEQIGQ